MGLLEKALKYKSEINKRGKETIIDRIPGPADTELMQTANTAESSAGKEEIVDDSHHVRDDARNETLSDEEIIHLDESLLRDLDEGANSKELFGEEKVEPIILEENESTSLNNARSVSQVSFETESDDLFSLPNEEPASPQEVLKKQTSFQKLEREETPKDKPSINGEMEDISRLAGYQLFADDPLGPEDAPVIVGKKAPRKTHPQEEVMESTGAPKEANEKIIIDEEEKLHNDRVSLERRGKQYQDFLVLHEIGKEIMRCDNRKSLFDTILFSIMGQIGTSSSSIFIADPQNPTRWIFGDSRGVTIRNKKMYFDTTEGIVSRVISRKQIVDLDEFKNQPAFSDDYYRFISIDARLLSPMVCDGEVLGAIVLGEKITIGDYSDAEKEFISAVSELSAIALQKVNSIERLRDEHERFKTELEYVHHVEALKARMASDINLRRLDEMIATEFHKLGIMSYAIFIDNERNERFEPLFVEKNDTLSLRSKEFTLPYESPLVEYIAALKECVKVDDHKRLKPVIDAFSESRLKIMPLLWVYPFKFGKKLVGFLLVFDIIDFEREKEIHGKLTQLSTVLFSYILNLKALDVYENRYMDLIEPILRRIEIELQNARNLKIPLTIVMFSIKNFKRYYTLYGRMEARRIIDALEMIIRTRLSDTDFSVRFDRNKVILVLPGKNKKYAIPLANTVRNEIIQYFKQKEVQLLVTFLSAEFPEDGEDLYTLLDIID
ncbi:MAG: diguanylate cyclase [Spirochaetes bacterium]|nr:diguanylate cyclase [Spirochaetota bacterium]